MASRSNPMLASSRKLDYATILGLVVAVSGILGGLILEGGRFSDVGQITAALIVLGGTTGAVMITTPLPIFLAAVKKMPDLIWETSILSQSVVDLVLSLAVQARKNGLVSLDRDIESLTDPFLKKAVMLAVDGTDVKEIRRIMEVELNVSEQRGEAEAKVFDAAGGYAPTVGIIGAVLGLIQVMKHLENMEAVGHGIAVAFVATVYGVAAANILFLPAAHKLKARLHRSLEVKEIMLEGVISIAEGLNPTLIRSKLGAYLQGEPEKSATRGGVRAPARAALAAE